MIDENNKTAITRFKDLVYIMSKLEGTESLDKENLASFGVLNTASKPFKPSSTKQSFYESSRSPLVDISEVSHSSIYSSNALF